MSPLDMIAIGRLGECVAVLCTEIPYMLGCFFSVIYIQRDTYTGKKRKGCEDIYIYIFINIWIGNDCDS